MKNAEKAHQNALKENKTFNSNEEDGEVRSRKAEANANPSGFRVTNMKYKYLSRVTPRMGQTRNSILLILGEPTAIDTKVTKKYKTEVFKYQPYGSNRYKLKITLKNGIVTEWEKRE